MAADDVALAPDGSIETRRFLSRFMALALVSGAAIALGRIATQLFAIDLGASPTQIGAIMAAEQACMVLMALPAGYLVARFGARRLYFLSSLGPFLVYVLMPLAGSWGALAAARAAIGLCIPFRIVSMNTGFLRALPSVGYDKAGWYRGSQTIGLSLIGPVLASFAVASVGIGWAFVISGMVFAALGLTALSLLPDARPDHQRSGFAASLVALLGDRDVFEACLVEHVASATNALFATFVLSLAIQTLGLSSPVAVTLIAVKGAAVSMSMFLGARAYMNLRPSHAHSLAFGGTCTALVLVGFAGGYAELACAALLLALASSLMHVRNMGQLARSRFDKSEASGLFNLSGMSGGVVGSLGGGLLASILPLQSVFLAWIGAPLALAVILALRNLRRAEVA